MIAIMTNKVGINTLVTFPIPALRSLCEMNHNMNHMKNTPISVGRSKTPALAKLELPPTTSEK